jgi:hypothetical protein
LRATKVKAGLSIVLIWLTVVIVIAALIYVIWTDPGLIKEIYEIVETWVS